jgi:hypothetical protein
METIERINTPVVPAVHYRVFFVVFEVVFFAVLWFVSGYAATPPMWLLAMMFPATLRMARTISFNEIAESLRAPFTTVVQDSCGAGSNVHPKGTGLTYAIGSLLACPICSGTWSALALYTIWALAPSFGQTLIVVLGVAGVSELLHWGGECLEWNGRAGRVYAGSVSPDKDD